MSGYMKLVNFWLSDEPNSLEHDLMELLTVWRILNYDDVANDQPLEAIKDIYSDRMFAIQAEGSKSSPRPQRAGISQGCPLSPFLFGMLMTILMEDARDMLSVEAREAIVKG